MIKEDARPHRHHGDRASAIKIIIPLLGKDPVLNLQKELVIERSQPHRSGSRSQRGNEQAARNAREDNRSHEEMTRALAAKDQKWVEELASADQEK